MLKKSKEDNRKYSRKLKKLNQNKHEAEGKLSKNNRSLSKNNNSQNQLEAED